MNGLDLGGSGQVHQVDTPTDCPFGIVGPGSPARLAKRQVQRVTKKRPWGLRAPLHVQPRTDLEEVRGQDRPGNRAWGGGAWCGGEAGPDSQSCPAEDAGTLSSPAVRLLGAAI